MEVENANPIQEIINKMKENSAKDLERRIQRVMQIEEIYNKLKAVNFSGLPELNYYNLSYGVVIEVENPRDLGIIHKTIGKLVLNYKRPVEYDTKKRGRKKQEIELHLCPEGLNYYLTFKIKRKLLPTDKCRVEVVTRKEVQVVCGVN